MFNNPISSIVSRKDLEDLIFELEKYLILVGKSFAESKQKSDTSTSDSIQFEFISILLEYLKNESVKFTIDSVATDRISKLEKTQEGLAKSFQAKHGESPQIALEKISKYNSKEIAKIYLEYCQSNVSIDISTYELGNKTAPSQPTWSRVFRTKQFWQDVHEAANASVDGIIIEIDNLKTQKDILLKISNYASGKLERNDTKLKSIDETNEEGVPKIEIIDEDTKTENNLYSSIDKSNIDKMNKNDIILSIIEYKPEAKKQIEIFKQMGLPRLRNALEAIISEQST